MHVLLRAVQVACLDYVSLSTQVYDSSMPTMLPLYPSCSAIGGVGLYNQGIVMFITIHVPK